MRQEEFFGPNLSREAVQKEIGQILSRGSAGGHGALVEFLSSLCMEISDLRRAMAEFDRVFEQQDVIAALRLLRDDFDEKFKQDSFAAGALPDNAQIDLAQILDTAQGIYQLEWTDDGRPFRWCGPGRRIHFSVRIRRSDPLIACLEPLTIYADFQLSDVKCFVDGEARAARTWTEAGRELLVCEIPPASGTQSVHMDYIVPTTKKAPAPDDRWLSMAISGFSIRPPRLEQL